MNHASPMDANCSSIFIGNVGIPDPMVLCWTVDTARGTVGCMGWWVDSGITDV